MDEELRKLVLDLLESHNTLSLATVREDGWPQATTVTYASEGLKLYVATGADAQKVGNIRRCEKVSLTIDRDYVDWNHIRGLSMAAHARVLEKPSEIAHAAGVLERKFTQFAEIGKPGHYEGWVFIELTPVVISVLDYTRGFGHTTLVHL